MASVNNFVIFLTKVYRNINKNYKKCEQTTDVRADVHKNLNLRNFLENAKFFKKSIFKLYA